LTGEPKPGGLLAIGRVSRAHGLRGELRVELHFDGSDALGVVSEIWLSRDAADAGAARRYEVVAARAVPRAYLLQVTGVVERDGAEALRGSTVWVAREALPEQDDGEYYLVDLLGAKVVGPEGEIGTVTEIATHPSVDALVIATPDGRTVQVPLVDDWIERVSVADKLVKLSSLDGLID
jgi:16S rRNA processing protein RimM